MAKETVRTGVSNNRKSKAEAMKTEDTTATAKSSEREHKAFPPWHTYYTQSKLQLRTTESGPG